MSRLAAVLLPALALALPAMAQADALDDQARAVFDAVFAETCGYSYAEDGPRTFEPRRHTFARAYAAGDPPQTFIVFEMYCAEGTYNSSTVYLMETEYDGLRPLSFAAPEWKTTYADAEGLLLGRIDVVGWRALDMLVNSEIDPETGTIRHMSAWRGFADAADLGTWELVFGGYRLRHFAVDPTFDEDFDPVTLYAAPGTAE